MSDSNDSKPKPPARRKISAFALATESTSVMAQIGIEDVLHICPTWTPEQAEAFLREHGDVIGPAMVKSGVRVLSLMLPRGNHA